MAILQTLKFASSGFDSNEHINLGIKYIEVSFLFLMKFEVRGLFISSFSVGV